MCPRRILHRAYFRWTILQPSDPAEAVSIYEYTCPFCNDIMTSIVAVVAAVGSLVSCLTSRVHARPNPTCGMIVQSSLTEGQIWCLDARLHCLTLPSETLQKLAPSPLAKRPKKEPPPVQNCMSLKDGPGAWMAAYQ